MRRDFGISWVSSLINFLIGFCSEVSKLIIPLLFHSHGLSYLIGFYK